VGVKDGDSRLQRLLLAGQMGLARVKVLAAAFAATYFLVPAADAAAGARPPVVWLKGEGNFTKSHRPMRSASP